ncbi:hypothetical protein ABE561_15630, partial [Pseudomonas asiatica]|uniref:hypothetical protein n=1 Tax=Pseudomonas asiatica TaxID=2219225 RepID=UPI003207F2FD
MRDIFMPASKNILKNSSKKLRTVLWRLAISGGVSIFWRWFYGAMTLCVVPCCGAEGVRRGALFVGAALCR